MPTSAHAPSPILSAQELLALMQAGPADLLILDTRFQLTDPDAGERAWRQGHIPTSLYAHLDRDLSAPRTGRNGRHPLPSPDAWQATLQGWGLGPSTQVVVCDDSGGVFAARLWWMLHHWSGHAAPVQVLDGGLAAWCAAGGALDTAPPNRLACAHTVPRPVSPLTVASLAEVQGWVAAPAPTRGVLIDARSPDRFRGENETLDPVGGHIPGALNRPFQHNLGPEGHFQPPDALRAAFLGLMNTATPCTPSQVVHQCGSGVTACHNLLAMDLAGLHGSRLFAGSWSQWCADPRNPVAR